MGHETRDALAGTDRATLRRTGAVLVVVSAVGLTLATLLGWGFAEVYEAVAHGDGIAGMDRPLLDAIVAVRTPLAARLVTWFSATGGPVGMSVIAAVVALALSYRARRLTPLVLTAVAAAGSLTMTVTIKRLVDRGRPPLADAVPPYESSASFPSGHSLNAIVIVGILVYCAVRLQQRQWVRVLTVVGGAAYALAIGLSRVYLGHHWLSDVVGAWLLGLAWLAVVVVAHRVAHAYADRARQQPEPAG